MSSFGGSSTARKLPKKDSGNKGANVPATYLDLTFTIAGKDKLELTLEETLVLHVAEDVLTYTDAEIENQLEKASYYRWVVYRAYIQQRQYCQSLKRDLDKWYANTEETAQTFIIREYGPDGNVSQGKGFSLSSLANMLSSSKIQNEILRSDELGGVYNKRLAALAKAEADRDELQELASIIKDRAIVLQGILKGRRYDAAN